MFRTCELEDSSDLLRNTGGLRARLEEDGYLFFRSLIRPDIVAATRDDIAEILVDAGYVDATFLPSPRWSGKKEIIDGAIHELQASGAVGCRIGRLTSLRTLYTSPEIFRVFAAVCDGDVFPWVLNGDRVKVKLPGHDTYAHQDTAYYALSAGGRAVPFYVAWVPFVDVGESEGGLVIERGSHHHHYRVYGTPCGDSFLPNSWCNFQVLGMPSNARELRRWLDGGAFVLHGDVLSFNDDREWMGADYHPGDVIVFHRRTVHKALTNTSKTIRLSADFRYQKAGTRLDFRATNRQAAVDAFTTFVRGHVETLGITGVWADRIIGLMLVDGPEGGEVSRIPDQIERLTKRLRVNWDGELFLPESQAWSGS